MIKWTAHRGANKKAYWVWESNFREGYKKSQLISQAQPLDKGIYHEAKFKCGKHKILRFIFKWNNRHVAPIGVYIIEEEKCYK